MTFRNLIEYSAVSVLAVVSLSAQSKPAPPATAKASAKIPRAADGHPDLTGLWSNATRTPFERPDSFAGKATLSDEEAKAWEAREAQRWEDPRLTAAAR